MSSKLAELIYVDRTRLEWCFEQISSPIKYDKTPVWKVAIGLTGPKAEAVRSRPGRTFSLSEKVDKFMDYVEKHDLVSDERRNLLWSQRRRREDSKKPFVTETLVARRAQISRLAAPYAGFGIVLERMCTGEINHDTPSRTVCTDQLYC